MDPQQQNDNIMDINSNTINTNNAQPIQSGQLPKISNSTSQQLPIGAPINIGTNTATQQLSGGVDSPAIAEDVDLIEKEWVNKAKKIVENTKNDPSQQNIQLNKFKADYLKIRFNKDIKPMDG